MADIQSATAEIGRGKKEEERRTNDRMKILWSALFHRATIMKLPNLYKLHHIVPATSSATEQVFSCEGLILSDRCSRLKLMMTFLNKC